MSYKCEVVCVRSHVCLPGMLLHTSPPRRACTRCCRPSALPSPAMAHDWACLEPLHATLLEGCRFPVRRFLNTIIDDLFAFVIKMPTLHRLSVFRDDLVFLVYIYQRWIYPVDKKRANEFGCAQSTQLERFLCTVSSCAQLLARQIERWQTAQAQPLYRLYFSLLVVSAASHPFLGSVYVSRATD